jgi:formylglycine-generating enzyme required for sulfatase activity
MRVLLVDPEGDLLPGLQGPLLGVAGVELYCAPDGPTAIQHAGFLGGLDFLITEVFLHGLDGFALRDTLQTATPALRTIFLTRHDLGAYAAAVRETPVLRLPVSPEQLLGLIHPPTPSVATAPSASPAATPARQPEATAAQATQVTTAPTAGLTVPMATPAPGAAKPIVVTPPVTIPTRAERESRAAEPPRPAPPPPLKEGLVLGSYRLLREEEPTRWGPTFAAVHATLGRSVILVLLSSQQAEVASVRQEFLEEAGAKAAVQHSAVLAVYEACEAEGHTFYAMERHEGMSLVELAERGRTLQVESVLRIAQAVGEGMQYMRKSAIAHGPLKASSVLLASDGAPRLQNIALGGLRPATNEGEDVATFGRCLEPVLNDEAPLALRSLLERTSPKHGKRVARWPEFLTGIAQCEAAWARFSSNSGPNPQLPPAGKRKFSPLVWVGLSAAVAAAAGGAFYFIRAREPLVPVQVQIPKGQYLVGSGRKVALEEFSIDRSEVSNRQYSRFLEWQRTHPAEANSFDHPDQPARQSHTPPYWKDMFPEISRHRVEADDPRWELPVTEVSWWDAYAFARWAGRDLPTEDEWEASGRGPRGFLFPWGDEPDPDRSNVKRLPRPGESPGTIAADSAQDASAFGVRGLSGNVSEWTSTVRENLGAVAKGGHFNAPLLTLDAASALQPDTRSPSLGFRTVARKSPRP